MSAEREARHFTALKIWLGLYPTITIVLIAVGPFIIGRLPLPVVTLVVTLLVVPLMVYVVMPLVGHLAARLRNR